LTTGPAVLRALRRPKRVCATPPLDLDERNVKSTCTHFKVLREAGLIRQRVVGTKRVNSLRREDIEHRFPGLLGSVLQGVPPVVE
jgi:DNA-binding transcriptional ArsR family regulator